MRIAVIGDIHTYRLWVAPWLCFNKRLLGQANLLLNRRFRFRRELLPAVWERVDSIKPDMLLFTGDVSTCALAVEFEDIKAMLKPLLEKYPAVMIPGNHDRYVPSSNRPDASGRKLMERSLGEYMPQAYPFTKKLNDRFHLLAMDATFPQLWAEGRIGEEQLSKAKAIIEAIPDEESLIVMCHYTAVDLPPGIHEGPRHDLVDAEAVREMLRPLHRLNGPTLYLHGHIHRPWCHHPKLDGLAHLIDINAGAPCNAVTQYPLGQGFWQFDLPEAGSETPIAIKHHVPDEAVEDGWQALEHDARIGQSASAQD